MAESPEPTQQPASPEVDESDPTTWPPYRPYPEAITYIDAGPPPWSVHYRKSLWTRLRERIGARQNRG
jgi:hypothetical protein